jgi:hypothetical protein
MGSGKKSPPTVSVGTVDLIPCPEYTGDAPFFQGFLLRNPQKNPSAGVRARGAGSLTARSSFYFLQGSGTPRAFDDFRAWPRHFFPKTSGPEMSDKGTGNHGGRIAASAVFEIFLPGIGEDFFILA